MELKVATFDCYGPLIDWEGGAASFLYSLARRFEPDPPAGRVLRQRWEEIQFGLLQGEYAPYREVLASSLRAWAGERGFQPPDDAAESFALSMESWQPFPDTVPALRAARDAGLRLWIISNTDRAIMGHSLRHLEVEFDGVTVAEDCHTYKPSTVPFEQALGEIELPPDQILHVAFGFKYDIGPAQRLGMPTAWVNRKQEAAPGPEQADHVCKDLWPLAGVAGG